VASGPARRPFGGQPAGAEQSGAGRGQGRAERGHVRVEPATRDVRAESPPDPGRPV